MGTMDVTIMPWEVGVGIMMLAEGTEKIYGDVPFSDEFPLSSGAVPTFLCKVLDRECRVLCHDS